MILFYNYSKAVGIQTFRLGHSLQLVSNSLLITAQSPPVTQGGFSNRSPYGNLTRISQKITNHEKQHRNEACGFVGAELSLTPTGSSWVTITSMNSVPSSQISSIAPRNAAEALLTQGRSWEHLPLGSTKRFPDCGLKFPGNQTTVFSFSES